MGYIDSRAMSAAFKDINLYRIVAASVSHTVDEFDQKYVHGFSCLTMEQFT